MSTRVKGLYQNKKTGEWCWDFRIRGHRFRGETGTKNREKAERLVRAEREKATLQIAAFGQKGGHMTFGAASTRWWIEKGQHRAKPKEVEAMLAWLQAQIGINKRLADIDDNLVAELVARRQGEGVKGPTVNRTMTEPLRAIMLRAGGIWKVLVGDVDWKEHMLPEAAPVEREATVSEEASLLDAMRPDYRDFFQFKFWSGLRLAELVGMRRSRLQLDAETPKVGIIGKGNKVAWINLTGRMVALLKEQPHMPGQDAVWTYEPQRKPRAKGVVVEREPITYQGAKTQWRRGRKRAGMVSRAEDPVAGFRLHDIRHTAATRVTRSGGLAVTQKLLRHSDVQTTMRYAHATETDVLDAMEKAQTPRVDGGRKLKTKSEES